MTDNSRLVPETRPLPHGLRAVYISPELLAIQRNAEPKENQ
jgi:hypothetical protein